MICKRIDLKIFFSIIVLVLILLFVFALGSQNSQVVSVNFLIIRQELSIASLLSIGMLLGGLSVSIMFSVWYVKMLMKLRYWQKQAQRQTSKDSQ
jgi:uncharacterized membrane protein YciS (DUF1049 family)